MLVDGYGLIFRAYYAIKNEISTSKGEVVNAVFGFASMLLDVLRRERPEHAIIAMEGGPTFRDEEFAEYKANRGAMPDDLRPQVERVRQLIDALNIPIEERPGYEADDVIGTLAQKAEKEGFEVFMMTPDKDYCQLVTDNIKIYRPAFMGNAAEVLDVQHVLERFEIERTEQVIDILGLQGDASDNIPGIPGIGEKTAKALIKQFGSVENLIANSDKLKGKQQENVRNFAEQGLMSKELATIHVNVPIPFEPTELAMSGPDEARLRELFDELEFRQLAARVLGGGSGERGVSGPGGLRYMALCAIVAR